MEEQILAMEKRTSEIRSSIVRRLGQVEDKIMTTVKGVQSGLTSAKETLNLRKKVAEHPVSMLLGSTLTGLITGAIVNKKMAAPRKLMSHRVRASQAVDPKKEYGEKELSNYAASEQISRQDWRPSDSACGSAISEMEEPLHPWWKTLSAQFDEEIRMIKMIALGAGVSLLERKATTSIPTLAPHLSKLARSIQKKLERMLPLDWSLETSERQSADKGPLNNDDPWRAVAS